jgi:hypothetical protein
MSDREFLAKRKAWLKLRKELEDAQEEIDLRTAAFLRSEGEAPTRKMMCRIDDLIGEVHEARCELDKVILDHAH